MAVEVSQTTSLGYRVGNTVWWRCDLKGFQRATIVSIDANSESFFLELRDEHNPAAGGQFHAHACDVRPFFDHGLDRTFEDHTAMVHLDDANILDNVRRRFMRDDIYTYTANVLLAVNPYKQMPHFYTTARMEEYRNKNIGVRPPHPYAIADTAFRHLLRERKNQALVISGESGAGKTETAKIAMRFLTSISRTDAAQGGQAEDKIVMSSPILESFGNASTVRNMNSSRFGKYNEMTFDPVGRLVGGGVKTFLLESSRVVCQQDGERNYHVFYEMLAGLEGELLEDLQLDPSIAYRLLYSGNSKPLIEGSPEVQECARHFNDLRTALATFASVEEQHSIWEVAAALIHLGEVDFVETEHADSTNNNSPRGGAADTSSTQLPKVDIAAHGQDALAQAADLLGLPHCRLEQVLRWKEMHVRRQGRRISHINCPRSKTQASQTLHNIVKTIYKRLFEKIVDWINDPARCGGSSRAGQECNHHSIGTLDIYGFERLQINSFEQMCINLANERLQQFFVEKVLGAEQNTYFEEGLNICDFKLPDSTPVVNSIQSVMKILNEHSLRAIKNLSGTGEDKDHKDQKFCSHVHNELIQDPRSSGPVMALKLKASRSGSGMALNDGFQIRHYAGDVSYSTRGWIDKNNDALVPELEALLAAGSKPLVCGMSASRDVNESVGEKLHSVSRDYLKNLDSLLATLGNCSVHYMRCFNPNRQRQSGVFDTKYVLDQIVQCGTVELVKIMHDGYPNRCLTEDLRERFTSLLPEDFGRYSNRDFVQAIMLAFEIDETQWTLGTKRLFLRAGQLRVLENLRDSGSVASKEIIAKIRVHFARKKLRAWAIVISLMKWWPNVRKRERRLVIIHQLRKATYIYVRLFRWLFQARSKIYKMPAASFYPEVDVMLHQKGITCSLPALPGFGTALRASGTGIPQLFVALNYYEEPQYASYLQSDVDHKNNVHEDVLKLWQKNTTESVLLYNGKSILSARFSPKAFLRRHMQDLPEVGTPTSRSVEDVRQVDVHNTGAAYPVAECRWDGNIICMCQQRMDKQIFATCDSENQILIWKWLGTDQYDTDKPAVKALSCFSFSRHETIFQMCFRSEVPQRVADHDGMILIVLSAEVARHWLTITVVSVYQGSHRIEHIHPVGVHSDLLPSMRQSGVQISFFTPSHTDRILVLGGRGLLQFYAIAEDAQGNLVVSLIADIAQMYSDIKHSSMVSCLSLPPPIRAGGILDWIVIGASNGKLYGFRFDIRPDERIEVNSAVSGRFRSNLHTEGIAIRSLIATYGATPYAHHKAVAAKGLSYSLFLNKAPLDEKGFYSLGEDGKLLTWRLLDKTGWTATAATEIQSLPCGPIHGWQPEPARETRRFTVAHSSRLVPHIIVMLDADRRLMMCYDRTKPEELSAEAMCAYA